MTGKIVLIIKHRLTRPVVRLEDGIFINLEKRPELYVQTIIYRKRYFMENKQLKDEDDIMVTLNLDNGQDVECKILTIFEAGKQDYIALMPLDEKGNENADGEVYIYRYSEDEDGNPSLDNIDSDEEYEVVSDRFDELLDEAEFDAMDN